MCHAYVSHSLLVVSFVLLQSDKCDFCSWKNIPGMCSFSADEKAERRKVMGGNKLANGLAEVAVNQKCVKAQENMDDLFPCNMQ